MQTPKMSFVESCTNVGIGYGVAVASQCVIFPMFGLHTPFQTNLKMGAWFTVVSIVRSYAVRRLFNKKEVPPCDGASSTSGGQQ